MAITLPSGVTLELNSGGVTPPPPVFDHTDYALLPGFTDDFFQSSDVGGIALENDFAITATFSISDYLNEFGDNAVQVIVGNPDGASEPATHGFRLSIARNSAIILSMFGPAGEEFAESAVLSTYVSAGEIITIGVTNSADGGGNYTTTFFWKLGTASGIFNELGNPVSWLVAVANSTEPVRIGNDLGDEKDYPFQGRIYNVTFYSDLNFSTPVFSFNSSDNVAEGSSWVSDLTSETWASEGNARTLKVDGEYVDSYMVFDGNQDDYAYSVTAASDFTNTLSIKVELQAANYVGAGLQILVAKITPSVATSYLFYINSLGNLTLILSNDGTTRVVMEASVGIPFSAGTRGFVGFEWVGNSVLFYTSVNGKLWTQLGTTQATTVTSLHQLVGVPITVGGVDDPQDNFVGNIYDVKLLTDFNDLNTLEVEFNPNDTLSGRVWISRTGETWVGLGDTEVRDGSGVIAQRVLQLSVVPGWAKTPATTANDLTGDFSIVGNIKPVNYLGALEVIFSRYDTVSGARFTFGINTLGKLFTFTDDKITATEAKTSSEVLPLDNTQPWWVGVSTTNSIVRFFYSTNGVNFTQLGTTLGPFTVTRDLGDTAVIGDAGDGSSNFIGDIWSTHISKNGDIEKCVPTASEGMDPDEFVDGAAWLSGDAEVWTLTGTVVLGDIEYYDNPPVPDTGSLNGSSFNYFQSQNTNGFVDRSGSYAVIVDMTPQSWTTKQQIAMAWGSLESNKHWSFYLENDTLYLEHVDINGKHNIYDSGSLGKLSGRLTVAVIIDVISGTNTVGTFYTSINGVDFAKHDFQNKAAASSSHLAPRLIVGNGNLGGPLPIVGPIYGMKYIAGASLTGGVIAEFNPNVYSTGVTWNSNIGETWELHGSAEIEGRTFENYCNFTSNVIPPSVKSNTTVGITSGIDNIRYQTEVLFANGFPAVLPINLGGFANPHSQDNSGASFTLAAVPGDRLRFYYLEKGSSDLKWVTSGQFSASNHMRFMVNVDYKNSVVYLYAAKSTDTSFKYLGKFSAAPIYPGTDYVMHLGGAPLDVTDDFVGRMYYSTWSFGGGAGEQTHGDCWPGYYVSGNTFRDETGTTWSLSTGVTVEST